MKNLIVIIVIALFSQSCATLLSGTHQKIKIESIPSGALVQVNGFSKGVTPLKVKIKKGFKSPEIVLKKEGYQDITFKPEHGFQALALLNLADPLGWAIDLATGSCIKYKPSNYEIQLDKK
jgi:hypothetical protein